MALRNRRLTDEEFENQRAEVLALWQTGTQADFDQALEFHKALLPHQNYAKVLAAAKDAGRMLLRSDTGVPSIEAQTEYLQFVQDEGGSDLLGTIIDSKTRMLDFEGAEQGLEQSLSTGEWLLNGFPLVHYGVEGTRQMVRAVDLPVMIRGVAPDWRLILEIGLASGYTCSSGAPFISFSQFSKDTPLETTICNFQYNHALMGRYTEAGVPMTPEISGGVCVLAPISMLMAATIVDAIIAAEQGVKHMCLMVHTQGNLVQDVAAMKLLPVLSHEFLERLGYGGVTLTVVSTSWSGLFPEDPAESMALICLGATAGVLGGAQVIHVKTVSEARAIPTPEDNAVSLRAGKKVVNLLRDQRAKLDSDELQTEMQMQRLEATAIVDRVLELGDGDAVVGAIEAVGVGVLDQVFPTNRHVAGRVIGVRDNHGAVRYLDHGGLPFDSDVLEFNRSRIAEREESQGATVDYDTVVEDLFTIGRGTLVPS
jgi:methylaspartate mutase epsilon subunit